MAGPITEESAAKMMASPIISPETKKMLVAKFPSLGSASTSEGFLPGVPVITSDQPKQTLVAGGSTAKQDFTSETWDQQPMGGTMTWGTPSPLMDQPKVAYVAPPTSPAPDLSGVTPMPPAAAGPPSPAPLPPPLLAKPGTPSSPFPAAPAAPPAASGGGLPLQAPAAPAAPAEGLYKGLDPLHFGQSPGAQKLTGIEGRSLYGQGEYAKQAAGHDAQYATDMVGVSQGMLSQADAEAAAAEKKAADRKAFLAKYNTETEARINEYANAEIKPDRLWAGSAGTGNAISAVIGSFVSGIAGYLDPSKDYVGQFAARIDRKIAEDIDLQKAQIAKKGAGIEARRGLYGSYLQQFGQEDAADAMAHETYLRKTKAQIDSYAAKTTNEKAKTQLGAMSAAIDDKIAMWAAGRQAAGESLIDGYYAQQAKAQAAAQQAAYARDKADDDANLAILKAKGPELGGVGIIRIPYGTKLPNGTIVNNKLGMPALVDANGNYVDTGTIAAKAKAEGASTGPVTTVTGFNADGSPLYGQGALVGKDPKEFNMAQKSYVAIKKDIATIKALREKHGGGALLSMEDIAKANQAAARIQLELKSPALFQLGVIAGPDKDYLLSQVPDAPLEIKAAGIVGSDPIGTKINGLESYLDDKYKNAEATYVKGGAAKNSALPLTKPAEPGK